MDRRDRSIAPAMPHTVWLAYRIDHAIGSLTLKCWTKHAPHDVWPAAADGRKHGECLLARETDSDSDGRTVHIDAATKCAVIPFHSCQRSAPQRDVQLGAPVVREPNFLVSRHADE